MKFCVDPRKSLANSPDVVLLSDEFPHIWENRTSWKSGPCYWHQNRQTGQTLYLFHASESPRPVQSLGEVRPAYYTTSDGGGFGGHVFRLKVFGLGMVHVRGPWSGGAYCANQYLPKHVIEVRRYDSEGNPHSLNLPIEMVNDGLRGTGWECVLQPNRRGDARGTILYEPMYTGINKDFFSDALMEEAHALYQEAAGNWLQDLQSQFRNKMSRVQEDIQAVGSTGDEESGSEADEAEHQSVGWEDFWLDGD